jgi:hypothetical protein
MKTKKETNVRNFQTEKTGNVTLPKEDYVYVTEEVYSD